MFTKVSVIISAYNAEKYIEQTLQSVLGQTWKPLEIIVVNDGSTDSTKNNLDLYKHKIKVVNQVNRGQGSALQECFRPTNG